MKANCPIVTICKTLNILKSGKWSLDSIQTDTESAVCELSGSIKPSLLFFFLPSLHSSPPDLLSPSFFLFPRPSPLPLSFIWLPELIRRYKPCEGNIRNLSISW